MSFELPQYRYDSISYLVLHFHTFPGLLLLLFGHSRGMSYNLPYYSGKGEGKGTEDWLNTFYKLAARLGLFGP